MKVAACAKRNHQLAEKKQKQTMQYPQLTLDLWDKIFFFFHNLNLKLITKGASKNIPLKQQLRGKPIPHKIQMAYFDKQDLAFED